MMVKAILNNSKKFKRILEISFFKRSNFFFFHLLSINLNLPYFLYLQVGGGGVGKPTSFEKW